MNEQIKFDNNICCDKKAYFFGYVYPQKMVEYKEHKKVADTECRIKFDMGVNDLIKIVDKSPEQKKFLRDYYKYSPLFNSKCTMNILAKYIEDMDFRYRRMPKTGTFDFRCLMSCDVADLDKRKLNQFVRLIKKYIQLTGRTSVNIEYASKYLTEDEKDDMRKVLFDALYEDFKNDALDLSDSCADAVNYIVGAFYATGMKAQKSLLWTSFGDELVENIKANSKHRYRIVENPNGKDYFGKKLTMIDEYQA